MKLLSGSIEIEKCGNTESKSKEAALPLELVSKAQQPAVFLA